MGHLADDLAVEHALLLAKELEHGRYVDERHAMLGRRGADALVTRADVGAARFELAAELPHRVNAPADALLRLEHDDARAGLLEQRGRMQAGEARADDHYVRTSRHLETWSSTGRGGRARGVRAA